MLGLYLVILISFAIIWLGKRELVALLVLCSKCHVMPLLLVFVYISRYPVVQINTFCQSIFRRFLSYLVY